MTHASVLYTSRGWSSDAGVPEAALDPADVAAIDPARPTKAVLASLLCVIAGYASARLSFHRPGKRRRAMNPLELLGSSIPDPRGLFIQPHPPQRHPGGSGHAKYPREYSTRVRFTVGTCSLPFRHVAILLTGHSRPYAFSHVKHSNPSIPFLPSQNWVFSEPMPTPIHREDFRICVGSMPW
jgi:hypothetical protein